MQPPKMRSIGLHSPLDQNFGGAAETNHGALLADGGRGEPQQDKPVLPKRHAVLRMPHDLQQEPSVPARILQRLRRQSANGESAQYERSGAEGDILVLGVTPPSYGFDLLSLPEDT